MKLQISLIPEKILDVLSLITIISFTFGMFILFAQYRLEIRHERDIDINLYKFSQAFLGDKCILHKELSKGILDYRKILEKRTCLNLDKNVVLVIDSEKLIYGEDCEGKEKKVVLPIIVFKENFKEGKIIVC